MIPVPHHTIDLPYQALLYDVLNIDPKYFKVQETSARVPEDVCGRVIHVEQISTTYKKKLARRRQRLIKKGAEHIKPKLYDDFYIGPPIQRVNSTEPAPARSFPKKYAKEPLYPDYGPRI